MRRNVIRVSGAVAASAALALSMSACSSSGSGSSKSLTIAFVGAQTGPNAQLGINISNGAALAIDQYNATKPKIKVTLKKYDTQGSASVAPAQAAKVIQDKDVAIIGPAFSGESKAVDGNFEAAKIPNISPSATAVVLGTHGWKYWHRIISNDNVQGQVDGQFIKNTLKATNAFVVDDNQEYSAGLADKVYSTLQGEGVKVARDKITQGGTDFSSTVAKVKASGATALFYGGYYAEAGTLFKQLHDGGYTGKILSDDGSLDAKLVSGAGAAAANGVLLSCACQSVNPSSSNPAVAKFITDYKAKWGVEQGTYSAEGFDAANLYLAAIKAGKTTGPAINDYLKSVNVQGVSKPIQFTPNGEITASAIYLFEVKSGAVQFLGDATKVTP